MVGLTFAYIKLSDSTHTTPETPDTPSERPELIPVFELMGVLSPSLTLSRFVSSTV